MSEMTKEKIELGFYCGILPLAGLIATLAYLYYFIHLFA